MHNNSEIETDSEREVAGGSERQWRFLARSEQTQAKKMCLSCSSSRACPTLHEWAQDAAGDMVNTWTKVTHDPVSLAHGITLPHAQPQGYSDSPYLEESQAPAASKEKKKT